MFLPGMKLFSTFSRNLWRGGGQLITRPVPKQDNKIQQDAETHLSRVRFGVIPVFRRPTPTFQATGSQPFLRPGVTSTISCCRVMNEDSLLKYYDGLFKMVLNIVRTLFSSKEIYPALPQIKTYCSHVHWVMCRIISEKAASFLHSKL
jgi:hypothetical protein